MGFSLFWSYSSKTEKMSILTNNVDPYGSEYERLALTVADSLA